MSRYTDLDCYMHDTLGRHIVLDKLYGMDTVDITNDFNRTNYTVGVEGNMYRVTKFEVGESFDYPGYDRIVLTIQPL